MGFHCLTRSNSFGILMLLGYSLLIAACANAFKNDTPAGITPLSWDDAYDKARKTLAQMTRDEKNSMLRSREDQQPGWFVGNINPIPHLGVPSLNMQDNGNGFRTTEDYMIGTVTCWPSALSMAATWDTQLVLNTAVAMGTEFAIKGANVILGPGVFLLRVAKGGRNWETLSGEDPYLGSRLGEQFVQGVQSMGVIATLKHYIFNNQENERNEFDVHVDDKTAWELYYPPFQAAVNAGAAAVMCSYNMEDGQHSCGNSRRLKTDLKGVMGFKGFVMSDWGAEYDGTTVDQGLDMDMVNGAGSDAFDPASISEQGVDDAVTRTLASIYKLHLDSTTTCVGGACDGPLHANARQGHDIMARNAATESIVLLQNTNNLLPLSNASIKKIRILGSAATATTANPNHGDWKAADLYSGGGSGHVVAPYVVTPMDGIKQRAATAGIEVLDSSSSDPVDVTIVVAGALSSESLDRSDLSLGDGADDLISSSAANGKVVVLLQVPGAVLMPWRDSVKSIAVMFLGGQETGNAWASVLFGDYAPTGHLPISIPASYADTIEPGSGTITYSEGLSTGYRNTAHQHAFPFGHGLTYTNFTYSAATSKQCDQPACVEVIVKNIGSVPAATVPQLYLEFPAAANHPTPLLKGFQKTAVISPGQELPVTFQLTKLDLSYWDAGSWHQVTQATAHIGASSQDIRVSTTVTVTPGRESVLVV